MANEIDKFQVLGGLSNSKYPPPTVPYQRTAVVIVDFNVLESSLQVPSDAPFELKPSSGKGWGAFATRRIEKGAMILMEKPLFIIRKPHEEIREEDVWIAIQQLAPREKEQFLFLRDNASKPFIYLTEAFAENSFAIPNSTRDQANDPPIHGIFLLHSRFNHSCIPNSKIPTSGEETITSFATRDIVAGEEITFCYNPGFECRTRHDRHQALRFVCDCKACLAGTLFQQLSDMRRRLIRGLQYLTLGEDLNGQRQGSASPIIVDSQLKRAAEDFSIPLSARLIYNILVVYLLEEEGLLDDFMIERLNPDILQIVALFETKRNVRIARLVIVQKTWLDKLNMDFRLYRRADIADHAITMQLRMPRGLSVTT